MTLKAFCYDDTDTIIAESVEDSKAVLKEMGCYTEDYEENEWVELPGDETLTITFEEERDQRDRPEGAVVNELRVTATVGAWIKHNGRGFLCSTEW